MEFRVGVGDRSQESVCRSQKLEFRVGVGERWVRFLLELEGK